MSIAKQHPADPPKPRRRLAREDRLRQLLSVAWKIVGDEGSDALTLGRLAEHAGVTKPVVYDHFATRAVLLAELYRDFDKHQTLRMDAAIEGSDVTLESRATVIASSYVDCVLLQGREIPGVIAALASTPELEKTKREYETVFLNKCRVWFSPFMNNHEMSMASLHAILGCAEALSGAAARDEISSQEAKDKLLVVILAIVAKEAL
ncbi:TetR/AcrR family transcriptional regulator [Pseudomonas sp. LD120]|uniref:TetR/AcrR family transcriptional regulator n=1 Tax=Pseudomonas sp. LD120 TaxID=485751 RepID=UPI0013583C73|nr:TetR/AcrR family transcriptional regulator [Pseudomonas sp. LD120]KAF0863784.1 TetR family transcriptional regulator [Pseudomonas sp. LD120]